MGVKFTLAEALIKIRADNKGANLMFRGIERRMKRFSSASGGIFSRFSRDATTHFGRASKSINLFSREVMRSAGILSAGMVALGGVRTAMDFEEMSIIARGNFRLLADSGEEAFQTIINKAREMGRTTNFTSTQAMEAMNKLALANFNVGKSIEMIEPILHLAATTNVDLAESAAIVGGNINKFGLEAAKAAEVADVLVSAQSRARFEAKDLGTMLQEVGGFAAALNVDFKESAALLTGMAKAEVPLTKAATALGRALGQLAKDSVNMTKNQQQVIDKLGLQLDRFKDAEGGFSDIIGLFQHLADANMDASDANQFFGERTRQIIPLIESMRKGSKDAGFVQRTYAGFTEDAGRAQLLFTKRMESFKNQLLIVKSALQDFAISTLTPLLAGMKPILGAFTSLVRQMTLFNEATGTSISRVAGFAVGLVTLRLGMIGVTIATIAATKAMKKLMFSNPFTALFTILSAIAVVVFENRQHIVAWWKESAKVNIQFKRMERAAKFALGKILEWLGAIKKDTQVTWRTIKESWVRGLRIMGIFFVNWTMKIFDGIMFVKDNWRLILEAVGLSWKVSWLRIKNRFMDTLNSMRRSIAGWVGGGVSLMAAFVKNVGIKFRNMVKNTRAWNHAMKTWILDVAAGLDEELRAERFENKMQSFIDTLGGLETETGLTDAWVKGAKDTKEVFDDIHREATDDRKNALKNAEALLNLTMLELNLRKRNQKKLFMEEEKERELTQEERDLFNRRTAKNLFDAISAASSKALGVFRGLQQLKLGKDGDELSVKLKTENVGFEELFGKVQQNLFDKSNKSADKTADNTGKVATELEGFNKFFQDAQTNGLKVRNADPLAGGLA